MPWSTAATAILRCLTGCAIGEVLGTGLGLHNAVTVVLSVVLVFVFGYGLTCAGSSEPVSGSAPLCGSRWPRTPSPSR